MDAGLSLTMHILVSACRPGLPSGNARTVAAYAAQGARRAEDRRNEAAGPGSATAMGMRRFVKRTIDMWRGGFDSRRVLMAQVRLCLASET